MRSDLRDLIAVPLPYALEEAARRGLTPPVIDIHSPLEKARQGQRSPRVIALRGDSFVVAHFLDKGPEDEQDG